MQKVRVSNEFQRLYSFLSDNEKKDFREQFMKETGRGLASFYVCLRTDTFRPLERKLFIKLMKKYGKAEDNCNA